MVSDYLNFASANFWSISNIPWGCTGKLSILCTKAWILPLIAVCHWSGLFFFIIILRRTLCIEVLQWVLSDFEPLDICMGAQIRECWYSGALEVKLSEVDNSERRWRFDFNTLPSPVLQREVLLKNVAEISNVGKNTSSWAANFRTAVNKHF